MRPARWIVQRYGLLDGWTTWVIYDEKEHADEECARRIRESPNCDKKNWRVQPEGRV